MTSPPLMLQTACQVVMLMVWLRKRTEPSHRARVTPPVWLLRTPSLTSAQSQPTLLQGIRTELTQYPASAAHWTMMSPVLELGAREAVKAPPQSLDHQPRMSYVPSGPWRISDSIAVLEVPSVMSLMPR